MYNDKFIEQSPSQKEMEENIEEEKKEKNNMIVVIRDPELF